MAKIPYAGAGKVSGRWKFVPEESTALRTERLEIRLTTLEKAKLMVKARATRRSVTSIVAELIENMDKEKGPE